MVLVIDHMVVGHEYIVQFEGLASCRWEEL